MSTHKQSSQSLWFTAGWCLRCWVIEPFRRWLLTTTRLKGGDTRPQAVRITDVSYASACVPKPTERKVLGMLQFFDIFWWIRR